MTALTSLRLLTSSYCTELKSIQSTPQYHGKDGGVTVSKASRQAKGNLFHMRLGRLARKCDGVISRDCMIFRECKNNLTFHDDHFQSAALDFLQEKNVSSLQNKHQKGLQIENYRFGWICGDESYLMPAFSQVQFFGVLFGTILFGSISDIFGRKPITVLTLSTGFLLNLLSGFATSWKILHTVRFLLGFCIGGTIVTLATLVTELLLPEQRMLLRGIFNWGIARLILTTVCMIFPNWRSASIVCALLLLPPIFCIIFVFPESPTWLHNKGRLMELQKVEQYIAEITGKKYEYVQKKSIEHVKTFYEMWRSPGLFRRLGVLWLMWFIASFSSYSNDLNSNTISGNLFVNQILFAILITISKLLTTPSSLSLLLKKQLENFMLFVVIVGFLSNAIIYCISVSISQRR
ncbi:hypothetical protein DICVIV_08140 [Dictyocaulus viviparus]|uniref:Major facilitator superfamily (MFS) profile domain-containing protein n=1 Tax=Dictyocaulus viviparus TaxID=29172 RepID=A0A0D8XTW7_DICVI|nr:hypothetical protein DICVIV_08140 [Dictyocaulus viviparus]